MEYNKSYNILQVKHKLGHRSINSTEIYTRLVTFKNEDYLTATSDSIEEDEKLMQTGFEYVTERDGVKIYRKRKQSPEYVYFF